MPGRAYLPLLGLTVFALGLGWTLPSIGTQAVVDPVRAGEAAGVNLTVMVVIAGVAVAVAGTLIELGSAGTADIIGATRGCCGLFRHCPSSAVPSCWPSR
jgi:hypothetical protein